MCFFRKRLFFGDGAGGVGGWGGEGEGWLAGEGSGCGGVTENIRRAGLSLKVSRFDLAVRR